MKRWPLIMSFVLFMALCASAAYWSLEFLKPPPRTVVAPLAPPPPVLNLRAAAPLFGGRETVAVATNYQLKGVIMSGTPRDSIAILAADGKPAQAILANREVTPGVMVKEVHNRYVLLSEGGVPKRVELPAEIKSQSSDSTGRAAVPARTPASPTPPPGSPTPPQAKTTSPAPAQYPQPVMQRR